MITFTEGTWPFETQMVFFSFPQKWLKVILFDVHRCQRFIKGVCVCVCVCIYWVSAMCQVLSYLLGHKDKHDRYSAALLKLKVSQQIDKWVQRQSWSSVILNLRREVWEALRAHRKSPNLSFKGWVSHLFSLESQPIESYLFLLWDLKFPS